MKKFDGLPLPEAILRAAIPTFVEQGYDKASMDEVAARAETTKRTVYAHYGSKEALFRHALGKAVELFHSEMPQLEDPAQPAIELENFLVGFSDLCTWRGAVRLQRVVMGEAERFVELGAMLHQQIIGHAESRLADYLASTDRARAGADRGREGYLVLAGMLLNMSTGPQRFATLLHARTPPPMHPLARTPEDADRPAIRAAVGVFLRGIGMAASLDAGDQS